MLPSEHMHVHEGEDGATVTRDPRLEPRHHWRSRDEESSQPGGPHHQEFLFLEAPEVITCSFREIGDICHFGLRCATLA